MNESDPSYISWKKWGQDSFAKYSKEEGGYFKKLFELANPQSGKNVLEIGFGNGGVMGYLRSHGYRVSGIEMHEELVNRARANGYKAFHGLDEINSGDKFDLIVMLDVLEHIPQEEIPALFLRFKELLNDDGKVLARFPNGDSPFGLRNQNGDVTHITWIGSKKIKFWANKLNFGIHYLGQDPRSILSGSIGKQIKKSISIPLRYLLRKFLAGPLMLPVDRHFFSPNLVAIMRKENVQGNMDCEPKSR